MTTSESRQSVGVTTEVVDEQQARLIASECPLTWRQVQEVLNGATLPRWREITRRWISGEDPTEVAGFVWDCWMARGDQ